MRSCGRPVQARSASEGAVDPLRRGLIRSGAKRRPLEVGDVRQLDNILANIRSIHTVYDAYRVVGG